MFNVSREFAPPFSLIAPFFVAGSIFYLLASSMLLGFGTDITHYDISVVAWAHLFLLGFVMMIIFGAMAQLVPVVLEVGHFSVDFYYLIWPILALGTVLMVMGFLFMPGMLPYGGLMVLVSMLIFLADTIMTLRKVEHVSLTVKTVAVTNAFLLLGILVGFAMALGIGTGVNIDIAKWLNAHIVLVLGGYVTLTIMGMSLILLPMFGLSHGFDESPIRLGFKIMVDGVLFYLLATLFDSEDLRFLAMMTMIGALGLYLYQIWLIYKTRARKEADVWFKSMVIGYASLAIALILGFIALVGHLERVGLAAAWFLIMGFFTFLINGHLYKIIPFLVWFERYSPLVGKQKVPMLADMVPKKMAEYQFWFSSAGVGIAGLGLLLGSDELFKAGVTFIATGAIFLVTSVKWMMGFGKK
ncbi:hypothetical protein [Hydrogenimonas urashimensis]|uniref:hypothetical protein n=1 Tax=Hydrogenimonas urashimensis TaxID=2740515 RepID=UPI001915A9D3|nr:hypothetical protein [Hydrogenimonas urashimensis]